MPDPGDFGLPLATTAAVAGGSAAAPSAGSLTEDAYMDQPDGSTSTYSDAYGDAD